MKTLIISSFIPSQRLACYMIPLLIWSINVQANTEDDITAQVNNQPLEYADDSDVNSIDPTHDSYERASYSQDPNNLTDFSDDDSTELADDEVADSTRADSQRRGLNIPKTISSMEVDESIDKDQEYVEGDEIVEEGNSSTLASATPTRKAEAKTKTAQRTHNPAYSERLMTTIRSGNLSQVRWLLSNGADPNYADDISGVSPVFLAVKSGWVDLAQVLYEAGGDFNKINVNGTSYLHIAAANDRLPMVKYLVSIGLSPHALTDKNWTPLHHAARFGNHELVEYLLARGADANLYTSDGFSPLGLALHMRKSTSVQLLREATTVAERQHGKRSISKQLAQLD